LALKARSEDEFVDFMLAGLPPAPEDHAEIRRINRMDLSPQNPAPPHP
jgi:hypothetical protein